MSVSFGQRALTVSATESFAVLRVLELTEAFAERIVRVLEVLGDVANRLLHRRRPEVVPIWRNGVESGDEPATEDVGEPHEGEDDAVRDLTRCGCLSPER